MRERENHCILCENSYKHFNLATQLNTDEAQQQQWQGKYSKNVVVGKSAKGERKTL